MTTEETEIVAMIVTHADIPEGLTLLEMIVTVIGIETDATAIIVLDAQTGAVLLPHTVDHQVASAGDGVTVSVLPMIDEVTGQNARVIEDVIEIVMTQGAHLGIEIETVTVTENEIEIPTVIETEIENGITVTANAKTEIEDFVSKVPRGIIIITTILYIFNIMMGVRRVGDTPLRMRSSTVLSYFLVLLDLILIAGYFRSLRLILFVKPPWHHGKNLVGKKM